MLEEYCYNWGQELNIKETKVIAFKKQGGNIKSINSTIETKKSR